MKFFSRLILSIILVALATNVSAEEKEYKATDNEEFLGKWILVDYTDGTPPQKVIFKIGSWDGYYAIDDKEPGWKAKNLITHKWTDAKGNILRLYGE